MALTHEATIKRPGPQTGDTKLVGYDIAFTANQLVEPETGWFLLNGPVVSQTTYPILYAKYGTKFNTGGEGAGNFRLPDLTDGKLPIPKGLTNFTTYGGTGGTLVETLSGSQIPVHSHSDTLGVSVSSHQHSTSVSGGTTASDGSAHTHGSVVELVAQNTAGSAGNLPIDWNTATADGTSGTTTHSHTLSASLSNNNSGSLNIGGGITASGGGGSHNNMGPYLVMGGWLVRHD